VVATSSATDWFTRASTWRRAKQSGLPRRWSIPARGAKREEAQDSSRAAARASLAGMQGCALPHSRRGKLARKAFVSPPHHGKGKGQFPFFCATSVSVTVT